MSSGVESRRSRRFNPVPVTRLRPGNPPLPGVTVLGDRIAAAASEEWVSEREEGDRDLRGWAQEPVVDNELSDYVSDN